MRTDDQLGQMLGYNNSCQQAHNNTENQCYSKALNAAASHKEQHKARNQCRDIGVDNGTHGPFKARVDGGIDGFSGA